MHRPGLGLFTNSLPHEPYVFIVFSLSKVTADGCAMQAVTNLLCDRLLDLVIDYFSHRLFYRLILASAPSMLTSPKLYKGAVQSPFKINPFKILFS